MCGLNLFICHVLHTRYFMGRFNAWFFLAASSSSRLLLGELLGKVSSSFIHRQETGNYLCMKIMTWEGKKIILRKTRKWKFCVGSRKTKQGRMHLTLMVLKVRLNAFVISVTTNISTHKLSSQSSNIFFPFTILWLFFRSLTRTHLKWKNAGMREKLVFKKIIHDDFVNCAEENHVHATT